MGFLKTGKKRKRTKELEEGDDVVNGRSNRHKRRARDRKAQQEYNESARTLNDLPAELLQHVFLISGNFDLPCCSKSIYSKLVGGSVYLHTHMLRRHSRMVLKADSQMVRALPTWVCKRRFVTRELLGKLGVDMFYTNNVRETSPCHVPEELENGELSSRQLRVVLYMVSKNCVNNRSGNLVMLAARSNQTEWVETMIAHDLKFDYRALLAAWQNGNPDLAALLFHKADINIGESVELWDYIKQTRNIALMEFLRQLGVNPPYHDLR